METKIELFCKKEIVQYCQVNQHQGPEITAIDWLDSLSVT